MITMQSPVCPAPLVEQQRIQLGHGSGGKMTAALLRDRFYPLLGNSVLAQQADAGVVMVHGQHIAVSTDSFVVNPLEFPGGDIGMLAVHGTLNDVAMMGARPLYLTAGFVLEEGLSLDVLDRIVRSMACAANAANVPIVAGDTKVVERGKADGLYINTTGIGLLADDFRPAPDRAAVGDVILTSGMLGSHGIAIMTAREGLEFEAEVESDTASLYPLVRRLQERLGNSVHVLRDPTRGGVASALNEIAAASRVGIELSERGIPIPPAVSAACEMLGLDPLYVANEGVLLAIVPLEMAGEALDTLRSHPLGRHASLLGQVVKEHPGMVVLRTALGATRVVDMLPGDQLPRIC